MLRVHIDVGGSGEPDFTFWTFWRCSGPLQLETKSTLNTVNTFWLLQPATIYLAFLSLFFCHFWCIIIAVDNWPNVGSVTSERNINCAATLEGKYLSERLLVNFDTQGEIYDGGYQNALRPQLSSSWSGHRLHTKIIFNGALHHSLCTATFYLDKLTTLPCKCMQAEKPFAIWGFISFHSSHSCVSLYRLSLILFKAILDCSL